jgi:hypothetical protein
MFPVLRSRVAYEGTKLQPFNNAMSSSDDDDVPDMRKQMDDDDESEEEEKKKPKKGKRSETRMAWRSSPQSPYALASRSSLKQPSCSR